MGETKKISIYLAGNIQKGHENESKIFWSQVDIENLKLNCSPIEITFLNPALRTDDLSDQFSVFGRDMTQVFLSDFILVDARERRGLGVGAEMMWAKMHSIPVITLAPMNSHYRKEEVSLLGQTVKNWTHPFIESLSDKIVESLEEAAEEIKFFISKSLPAKNSEFIQKAMKYYQNTQFPKDMPMHELINSEEFLVNRLRRIREEDLFSSKQEAMTSRL